MPKVMSNCYHPPMAIATTTVRLPTDLQVESEAFAASLGISLNALMAVALRDYLDGRTTRGMPLPVSPVTSARSEVLPSPKPAAAAPVPSGPKVKPPASRSDPCPCGAMDPLGYHRLKYKQCHGRIAK